MGILKNLCRKSFKYFFSLLLSGGAILFVGCPKEIPKQYFQKEIFQTGCYFSDSNYRAKIFLSQGAITSSVKTVARPIAVVVYDVEKYSEIIAYAHEISIPVLGICQQGTKANNIDFPFFLGSGPKEPLFCYWLFLHFLKKFRTSFKKKSKKLNKKN